MRTFVAVLCAAFAGLAVIGAMSSVASHDSGDAMFLGLLGGAAAMGAALAFRRPTEAERLARQAKRDARREARLARRRQRDPRHWEKRIAVALLIAIGAVIASAVLTKQMTAAQHDWWKSDPVASTMPNAFDQFDTAPAAGGNGGAGAFDPDAYLREGIASKPFDPDEYLGNSASKKDISAGNPFDRFDAAPAKPAQDRFPATNVEVLGDRVTCDVRYQELKLPPAQYQAFKRKCMGSL